MIPFLLSILLGLSTAHAAGGELTVVAKPATGALTAPRGAQRLPMLTLEMTATCAADVPVRSITLQHEGLGATADLSGVYAFQNGKRVTRSATFSARDGVATLRFKAFTVKACERTTLSVLVDLSAQASTGGQHLLTLSAAESIDAGGAVVKLQKIGATKPTQTATVSRGTITVTYVDLPRRVDYGADRIVARVRLDADGEANQKIESITFTNDGKARDTDLRNLWLGTTRGERISVQLDALDGDQARFTFEEPLILERNATLQLLLHADVRASRSQTIRLLIEEPSDIEAIPVRGRISR